MIETSQNIAALTAGLLHVQGSISGVNRDKVNPHFKTRYATLENVIDTARGALQEAKIAFVQAPGQVVDGSVEVTTMLVHESGEWMRSTLHVPLGKRDAQGVGSAITYGCRYSLMAMLGLPPTDDDDGHAASTPPAKREVGWSKDGTERTAYSLRKEKVWEEFQAELLECKTAISIKNLALAWSAKVDADRWPETWKDLLRDEMSKRLLVIKNMPAPDDDVFPGDRVSANDESAMLDQRMRDERAALANHPLNSG